MVTDNSTSGHILVWSTDQSRPSDGNFSCCCSAHVVQQTPQQSPPTDHTHTQWVGLAQQTAVAIADQSHCRLHPVLYYMSAVVNMNAVQNNAVCHGLPQCHTCCCNCRPISLQTAFCTTCLQQWMQYRTSNVVCHDLIRHKCPLTCVQSSAVVAEHVQQWIHVQKSANLLFKFY